MLQTICKTPLIIGVIAKFKRHALPLQEGARFLCLALGTLQASNQKLFAPCTCNHRMWVSSFFARPYVVQP